MENKLKNILIVVLALGFITALADSIGITKQNKVYAENAYCERCIRLEKAIRDVMRVIEYDEPDYVMDVLSETDEYLILDDLVGLNFVEIPDSTYRKMQQVFPDMPAKQASPNKPLKPVDSIDYDF